MFKLSTINITQTSDADFLENWWSCKTSTKDDETTEAWRAYWSPRSEVLQRKKTFDCFYFKYPI